MTILCWSCEEKLFNNSDTIQLQKTLLIRPLSGQKNKEKIGRNRVEPVIYSIGIIFFFICFVLIFSRHIYLKGKLNWKFQTNFHGNTIKVRVDWLFLIYWSGNSGHTVYLNNIQIYRETSFKQVSIICKECISLQRKNPENLLVVNTNGKIHDTDHKSETILKWNKRTNRKLNVGKKTHSKRIFLWKSSDR